MKNKLLLVMIMMPSVQVLAQEPFHFGQESPFGAPQEHNPFGAPSPFGHEEPSPFGRPEERSPFGQEESPFGKSAESPFGNANEHPFGLEENRSKSPFGKPEESFGQETTSQFGRQPESFNREETHSPFGHESPHAFNQAAQRSVMAPESYKESAEETLLDSQVDTFDKDSGNWVLKRAWWEKIQALYEQIKQVFNDIMSARMDFISQRNRLDRELDVFYGQIGLEEGQLQDTVEDCLALLKKEKTEEGYLDKDEETFMALLQTKQRDLEQLKLDIKALQDLDHKIDEALDVLFKQIDIANQYEQKAWELFKNVAQELNDKIARKSYYETEGLLKDIKNVHSYITGQFSSYFSQTIQTAQTHSKSISMQMQNLTQSGVDLKKRFDALQHVQEERDVKQDLAKEEAAKKKKEQDTVAKPTTFVGGFVNSVKVFFLGLADTVLSSLTSVIAHVQSWFEGEQAAVVVREKKLGIDVLNDEKKAIEKVDTDLEKAQKHIDAEKVMVADTEKHIQEQEKEHPVEPMPEQLPHTFAGLSEKHQEGFDHNPFVHQEEHPESAAHPEEHRSFGQSHAEEHARPVSVMPEQHEPFGQEHRQESFHQEPMSHQEQPRPIEPSFQEEHHEGMVRQEHAPFQEQEKEAQREPVSPFGPR